MGSPLWSQFPDLCPGSPSALWMCCWSWAPRCCSRRSRAAPASSASRVRMFACAQSTSHCPNNSSLPFSWCFSNSSSAANFLSARAGGGSSCFCCYLPSGACRHSSPGADPCPLPLGAAWGFPPPVVPFTLQRLLSGWVTSPCCLLHQFNTFQGLQSKAAWLPGQARACALPSFNASGPRFPLAVRWRCSP